MNEEAHRRMGAAAIAAGILFFLGQGGELVFGDDSRVVYAVLVILLAAAILAFAVAFWTMRRVLSTSRAGRVGALLGFGGALFLVAFAVQLGISVVDTGEVPNNFILFAIGFLLIFVAHLVVARPLRAVLGGAWWLSPVAAVTLLLALVVNEIFIWHDLALFAFEGCWVAIGWLTLRRASAPSEVAADA